MVPWRDRLAFHNFVFSSRIQINAFPGRLFFWLQCVQLIQENPVVLWCSERLILADSRDEQADRQLIKDFLGG